MKLFQSRRHCVQKGDGDWAARQVECVCNAEFQ